MKFKDLIIAEFYQCQKCGEESIIYPTNPKCCNYPNLKPVRYYDSEVDIHLNNDNYIVSNQCQNCGKRRGNSLPKKNFEKETLSVADRELEENTEAKRIEIRELANELSERKKQKNREDFWDDYDNYLKSERWQNIRSLVLERDNHLCQSCLNSPADEVHHTIGHFRKNEPLYTLVALCSRCHSIITEIERGNHRNAKKIIYNFEKKEK